MSFSDYWENEILDHILNDGAYAAPTIYIGLSTADPGDDAAGLAEPAGNNYARVATANTDWDPASGGSKANATAITFPEASGSWGTVTYVCYFDADTDGNLLASYAITGGGTAIGLGNIPRFNAGDLVMTLG